MSTLISVVVCTYNRASLLSTALKSLCNQTLDRSLYEIIIVDNNSTDDTREVAEAFGRRSSNIRYVVEKKQALSHARNRGWQEARGDYIGYIDDDAKAPEEWLTVAGDIISTHAPGIFGGPYYAFYNSRKPKWWKDEYRSVEHAERARPLGEKEYLSGNNIFFQRRLLAEVGGFDPRLGMAGEKIRRGEETELLLRVREMLPETCIYYDPSLLIYHLVPQQRMTLRWLMQYWFAAGRSGNLVFEHRYAEERSGLVLLMLQAAMGFFWATSQSLIRRDRERYPYIQNYIFEITSKRIRKLGSIYERWINFDAIDESVK